MLTNDLFDSVLIKPHKKLGANNLFIVSGYATSAMAFHHLRFLKDHNLNVNIKLLIGMCAKEGMSESNHRGFSQLMNKDFNKNFSCSYLINQPAVHSKVYVWFKNNSPLIGFVGSANYTQTAFEYQQMECMTEADPIECFKYYETLVPKTIYCNHLEAEDFVGIYNDKQFKLMKRPFNLKDPSTPYKTETVLNGLPKITVSFLDRYENLPKRSGLNWGQREGREPNQAYIKLNSDIYYTDFFPERKIHFTILTDDKKTIICTRAQDNGKAIETPHNNSLIGEYFRNRLGLSNGALVLKEHLINYGRTSIDFYKIDDETFYMDFSKPFHG